MNSDMVKKKQSSFFLLIINCDQAFIYTSLLYSYLISSSNLMVGQNEKVRKQSVRFFFEFEIFAPKGVVFLRFPRVSNFTPSIANLYRGIFLYYFFYKKGIGLIAKFNRKERKFRRKKKLGGNKLKLALHGPSQRGEQRKDDEDLREVKLELER